MGKDAFTLIEVLVTIVILGTVAGLAVPVYTSTIENSRVNEAKVNLNAIYMAQRIYKVNNGGDYWNGGNLGNGQAALNTVNTNLNLDLVGTFYSNAVTVTANNAAVNPNDRTFAASLTRTGGGATYSIDQTGVVAGP